MKTKLLILLLTLTAYSFSQSKQVADRFYKEYNYKKSSEIYLQLCKNGNKSKEIVRRLGDCFYLTSNTKEAEKWYKELISNYKIGSDDTDDLFKYAQTLKNNGKYEKADEVMLKLRSLDPSDTRTLDVKAVPNYVSLFNKNDKEEVHIKNVSINTKYSDFGGFATDQYYYFASAKPNDKSDNRLYNWTKQPFLNLYKSKITTNGDLFNLENKEIFSKPITSKYHEASAIITKDGKTMYFTRDNFEGGAVKKNSKKEVILKIFKAVLVNNKWSNIKELPFNSNEYSTGHPALSSDEKILYFVSNRPGGFGETDIYKVSINNGNYGEPVNLGSTINTKGREMFPSVRGNSLYLSSDGHLGLGGLDIFKSDIKGNSYSKPQNIRAPFNSKLDDFGFWIDTKNRVGFFSSNRKGGKGDDDIYSFKITKKEPVVVTKKCEQQITGTVTDSNNNTVLSGVTVKMIDAQGKIVDKVITNENGVFKFTKECISNNYTVIAEKKNFKSGGKKNLKTTKENTNYQVDLTLKGLIVGNQIVINPIYFDYGKSVIRSDAAYELEDIVTIMKNNPEMIIKIESHTDSRGRRSFNRTLSDRRAKSTRDYIISRGIFPNRIQSAIGYGEDRLLNDCNDANSRRCSEEEHAKNRRSYFYILDTKYTLHQPREVLPTTRQVNDDFHTVKKGQTLYRVSVIHGISVARLKQLNNLKNNNVFVGQKLKLR